MIRSWLSPFKNGLVLSCIAALVAGCGSGTNSAVGTLPISTSPSTTATVASGTTAPTSIALAPLSGIAPTVTLPANSTGPSAVTIAESASAPASQPAIAALARETLSAKHTPLTFISITSAQTVTFPSFLTITFALTTIPPGVTFGLASLDPSAVNAAWSYGTTVALSGSSVTLTTGTGGITLKAGVTYYFALTTTPIEPSPSPSIAPSPSPSIAPSPSPTPVPVPVVAPTALTFTNGASSATQTFTASEANYTGVFTTGTCTSGTTTIATISGTSPTFTVTPIAAGTCALQVSNSFGGTATETINVNVTNLTITGVKRN